MIMKAATSNSSGLRKKISKIITELNNHIEK